MAYFSRGYDAVERSGKILADVVCALLLLGFAIAYFGWLGGAVAFLIVEGGLLAVEYVLPGDDGDAAAVVR
ncbi:MULTISPECIES: hypothetical protein [unclassified Bradyrhizobium]|uniref:hypothetical protein n=1 Tax=unclassified Bradyrhizobium TaxID=2631580 RepID=UPI002FF119E5